MKRYKLMLHFMAIMFGNQFAQSDNPGHSNNLWYEMTFASYQNYVSKEFGIQCKVPEKFTDLVQFYVPFMIKNNTYDGGPGFLHGPIFEAENNESILLYPAAPDYVFMKTDSTERCELNDRFPRGQITSELKAIAGGFDFFGNPLNDSIRIDFNDYVTMVAGKKARELFNADTLYMYSTPVDNISCPPLGPSLEKYAYVTSVFISKKDRATLVFRILVAPERKGNTDYIIDLLGKLIWYDEDFRQVER